MSEKQFNEVNAILRKKYKNAEIDKDLFVIRKEELAEGNLKEKGI